jgi:hypothetical protein
MIRRLWWLCLWLLVRHALRLWLTPRGDRPSEQGSLNRERHQLEAQT